MQTFWKVHRNAHVNSTWQVHPAGPTPKLIVMSAKGMIQLACMIDMCASHSFKSGTGMYVYCIVSRLGKSPQGLKVVYKCKIRKIDIVQASRIASYADIKVSVLHAHLGGGAGGGRRAALADMLWHLGVHQCTSTLEKFLKTHADVLAAG